MFVFVDQSDFNVNNFNSTTTYKIKSLKNTKLSYTQLLPLNPLYNNRQLLDILWGKTNASDVNS